MTADHSGDDRLVPPIPNHPGAGWLPQNVAQKLLLGIYDRTLSFTGQAWFARIAHVKA
jgi:hypothetical protein